MQEVSTGGSQLLALAEWTQAHDQDMALRLFGHVAVVLDVVEGRLIVPFPGVEGGLPDAWSLRVSSEAIRDMANQVGFVDAAFFCQQTMDMADEMVMHLEQACGIADHTALPRVRLVGFEEIG